MCSACFGSSQLVDHWWSHELLGWAPCRCCRLQCSTGVGDQMCLLGGWDGIVGLPPWSTPVGARLSVLVQCGSPSCARYAVLTGDYLCLQKSHAPWARRSICSLGVGMGLCSRDATSSPRSDLNGPRPNFKGMTFSAMTVITRRLRNTQAC